MLRGGRATKRKRGAEMNIRKRVETEWIKIAIGLDSTSKTAIFLDTILKVLDFEPINIENEVVKVVFDTIKDDVQKEAEKQKSTSEKNSKNGSKGGNAKWEKERQTQANYKQADAPPQSPKEEATIFEAEQMEKYPFEDFYEAFGNKKKPKEARKAWSKLKEEEKALAMEKVSQYVSYIRYRAKKENWETKTEYQMLPSSYLNGKCWEGEYETPIIDNQNANNYGSNNRQYNNKEAQRQQNLREMGEWLAEAAANVQPINPTESGN